MYVCIVFMYCRCIIYKPVKKDIIIQSASSYCSYCIIVYIIDFERHMMQEKSRTKAVFVCILNFISKENKTFLK